MFDRRALEEAGSSVQRAFAPAPPHAQPRCGRGLGTSRRVQHEHRTPIGSCALPRRRACIPRGEEAEIRAAMRSHFTDTRNLAAGAGAATLAAAVAERDRLRGRSVGVVLSGGNLDLDLYRECGRDAGAA